MFVPVASTLAKTTEPARRAQQTLSLHTPASQVSASLALLLWSRILGGIPPNPSKLGCSVSHRIKVYTSGLNDQILGAQKPKSKNVCRENFNRVYLIGGVGQRITPKERN